MINLDVHNRIIEDHLVHKCKTAIANNKQEATDLVIADFDNTAFHVSNPDGNKNLVMISISLNFYKELQKHGADEILKKIYGSLLLSEPENGYSVSLVVDVKDLVTNLVNEWQEIVHNIALLKRNCFASVFEKYFDFQERGDKGNERAVICFRSEETLYVQAQSDRVTAVFSTVFHDNIDLILARVFMQEFREGLRASHTSPKVLFSDREPPLELINTNAKIGDNIGYVTFVLFPRHTNRTCRNNTIDLIHMFRNYLHYHITCTKAFIHSHIRVKISDLLKVLNRAIPEQNSTEKKTISGKTFIRRSD